MATRRSSRKARRAVVAASKPQAEETTDNTPEEAPSAPAPREPEAPKARSEGRASRRAGREEAAAPRRSGRRRSSAAGEATGSKTPPIRDGKAAISCPTCNARYKIAEENLELKVTCTQCHRAFFPLAAAKVRRKSEDSSKPIIYGIVGVAAIIVVGVIINSLSSPEEPQPAPKEEKKVVELGKSTAEVQAVMKWAQAVGDRNALDTEYYSSMDALQKKLDIDKKNLHSRSFGAAKTELTGKIVDAVFDCDEALVFRAYTPNYGRIENEEMVARKKGRVNLSLSPKDSKIHRDSAEATVWYEWDSGLNRFVITDWQGHLPVSRTFLEEQAEGKTGSKHKPHELIGKAEQKEITFGGKKYKVEEAELVPLPHLDTTSEEDRKKIDALISRMIDLNASGMEFNRSSNELEKFGKAAVPRVLNKMYETKMKSAEDVMVLNRLCRFLRHLTGERFGFNPADQKEGSDIGGTEAERISSLKQWYAWWGRYYDRDDWKNIDSDEDIELTQEEIEAKKEAERQARIEARKARNRK